MLPTPINNQATNTSDNSASNGRQNKGTGFTNIGSILNANQGAGAKIGQAVGDSIAGQANQVKAGIQSSQDQFNTDSNAAKTTANNTIQAGQQYARQAGETDDAYAARVAGGTDDTADYSKIGTDLNNASYTGPSNLSNADQLNSQAANVSALGRLAGTQSGQSQLLRSQVAQRGNYSTGQNALDSLLLGQDGQQYVQQGRQQATQVGQLASSADANAQAQAAAAQSAINNNKTSALQALQNSLTGDGTVDASGNPTGITGLTTAAQNSATAYQTQAQRLQQLIAGVDASGNKISSTGTGTAQLTDSDKDLLSHMSDYGINPINLFVDPNNPQAYQSSLQNVASQLTTNGLGTYKYTDTSRTAAENLAKLLGQSDEVSDIGNQTFNSDILSDTGATNAQTALNSLADGINSQISDNSSRGGQLNSLQNYVNGLTSQWNSQPGISVNNLNDLPGIISGDARYGNANAASANSQKFTIADLYSKATGRDYFADEGANADKNFSDFFGGAAQNYNDTANNLTQYRDTNTEDLYTAALNRLLSQGNS